MTFRKKNPQLVTIFFMHDGGANKSHKYRVPKKAEFINALQVQSKLNRIQ
jgi:sulfur relay (sulfurtransferase) complex TusBCD TusD component (DsrE family)